MDDCFQKFLVLTCFGWFKSIIPYYKFVILCFLMINYLLISFSKTHGLVPPPHLLVLPHRNPIMIVKLQIISMYLSIDYVFFCLQIYIALHAFFHDLTVCLIRFELIFSKVHWPWGLQTPNNRRFWVWKTALEANMLWSFEKVCLANQFQQSYCHQKIFHLNLKSHCKLVFKKWFTGWIFWGYYREFWRTDTGFLYNFGHEH